MSYTNRYGDPTGDSGDESPFDGANSLDGGVSRATRHNARPVTVDTEALKRLGQSYTAVSENVFEVSRRIGMLDSQYADAFGDDSAGKKGLAQYTKLKSSVAEGVKGLARTVQVTGEGLGFQAKIAEKVEENNILIGNRLAPAEGGDPPPAQEGSTETPATLTRLTGQPLQRRALRDGETMPALRADGLVQKGITAKRLPQGERLAEGLEPRQYTAAENAPRRTLADKGVPVEGAPRTFLAQRRKGELATPAHEVSTPTLFSRSERPVENSEGLPLGERAAWSEAIPATEGSPLLPREQGFVPAEPGIPASRIITTPDGPKEVVAFPADPAGERQLFVDLLRADIGPGAELVVRQGEQPDGTYLMSPAMINRMPVDGEPPVQGWVLPADDPELRRVLLMGALERTLGPGETLTVRGG